MSGRTARQSVIAAFTLMSSTLTIAELGMSKMSPAAGLTAALDTSASTRPKLSRASAASRSRSAGAPTCAAQPTASMPRARRSRSASSTFACAPAAGSGHTRQRARKYDRHVPAE